MLTVIIIQVGLSVVEREVYFCWDLVLPVVVSFHLFLLLMPSRIMMKKLMTMTMTMMMMMKVFLLMMIKNVIKNVINLSCQR